MSEQNTGPVEVTNPVTQQGSTFAKRAAAAKKSAEPDVKAVEADDAATENKAVKSAATKSRKS